MTQSIENDSIAIGQRISEVLNNLKIIKQITGDKEIAAKLGYKSASSITEIKKGRQMPSVDFLNLLEREYRVSKKYILGGIGMKYLNEEPIQMDIDFKELVADMVKLKAAMTAAIKILTLKTVELETKVSKRPLAEVSLEIERMIAQESELLLAEMRLKQLVGR